MGLTTVDKLFSSATGDPVSSIDTGSPVRFAGGVACNGIVWAKSLRTDSTNDSTSSASGSLIAKGGVGIAKNCFVGGQIRCESTEPSTSTSTGSIVTDGGLGILLDMNIGGNIIVESTVNTTSPSTGSIRTPGGLGVSQDLLVSQSCKVNGTLEVYNTTNSTSPTTGSAVIEGGIGVNNSVNVGGRTTTLNLSCQSTTDAGLGGGTGAGIFGGGVSVAKNLVVNGRLVCNDSTDVGGVTPDGSAKFFGGVSVVKSVDCNNLVAKSFTCNRKLMAKTAIVATSTLTGGTMELGNIDILTGGITITMDTFANLATYFSLGGSNTMTVEFILQNVSGSSVTLVGFYNSVLNAGDCYLYTLILDGVNSTKKTVALQMS